MPAAAAMDERRVLHRAVLLSLLLHGALFSISGSPPTLTSDPNAPVDLRLWIDAPGDREINEKEVANVRVAAATPVPTRASPSRPSLVSAADIAAAADEPALPLDEAVAKMSTDSPHATPEPIVATVGASPDAVAVEDASAAPAPREPMAATERAAIATRVLRWSRAFSGDEMPGARLSWQDGGRRYQAQFERQPAQSSMDLERVAVRVTTEHEGRALTTRMQLKRLAFSHFTKLVDHWDENVQLHDDRIDGRFHSNSKILLGWDRNVAPRFFGKVSTSDGYAFSERTFSRMRREIFSGGIETRAPRIEMSRYRPAWGNDVAQGRARRHQFATDTRVIFYGDGTYGWRALEDGAVERRTTVGEKPLLLLGPADGDIQVSGSLRGTVLVYAPRRIVVVGSLRYARDVRAEPDAGDYLGLVSDGDVEVASAAVTGPGDLEIEAAIYARREFAVRDYTTAGPATLTILGSVSAGSVTATEPRFATHFEFDRRFERLRPPGFPETNRFELDDWNGQWTQVTGSVPQ